MNPWMKRAVVALAALVILFNAGGIITVRLQAGVDRRPDPSEVLPPVPLRVEFEQVTIPSSDGVELDAWFLPASPSGPAAGRASVLVLPGSGMVGHPDAALKYGPVLTEAGYNVLSFSYRGRGRSSGTTRNGILLGLESLIEDAQAALTYLRSRPGIGNQPVGALGCSLGTGVALGLAAGTGELKALLLDSPWADFVGSQESQAELGGRGWHNRIPFFWHLLRFWASVAFQVDVERTEPVRFLARPGTAPLFIVHRTEDPVLHSRQGEALYKEANFANKQIWLVPGRGHCDARYAAQPEFREQVRAFFGRWLNEEGGPGFELMGIEPREREMAVSLKNQTGQRLPLALTLHRPDRREPPQEFRVWLEATPDPQGYLLPISSLPDFLSLLRHYRVQDRGPSWAEELTPDAQAWRKMGEAESLAAKGQAWEARWSYEEAQRLAPENPRVHYEAGVYLFSRGWYDEASDAFFRTLTTPLSSVPGPDPREWKALALVYTGRILDLRYDRGSALGSYRQAKEFGIPSASYLADQGIRAPYTG